MNKRKLLGKIRELRSDRKHTIWEYEWYSDNSVEIVKDTCEERETRHFNKISMRAKKALILNKEKRQQTREWLQKRP